MGGKKPTGAQQKKMANMWPGYRFDGKILIAGKKRLAVVASLECKM